MATVRITDDETNRALKAMAKAQGISATVLANQILRRGVGLDALPAAAPQPVDPPGDTSKPRARGGPARLGRPKRARGGTSAASCPHPVGRRIGNTCLVCGATV